MGVQGLKLYEDAIRSTKKTDTTSAVSSAEDVDSSDHLADEEPHTEPADEEDETPSDEAESAAEKASISTGKGQGLTKSKLKGLKRSKKRSVLSMSYKSGDMDETTFMYTRQR